MQQIDGDPVVAEPDRRSIGAHFEQIDGQFIIDVLYDLEFLVVAVSGIDGALDLFGKLRGVIGARAQIDGYGGIPIIDVHQQEIPSPENIAVGFPGIAGRLIEQGVSHNLDQLVAFFTEVEAALFATDRCGLRRDLCLQIVQLVKR